MLSLAGHAQCVSRCTCTIHCCLANLCLKLALGLVLVFFIEISSTNTYSWYLKFGKRTCTWWTRVQFFHHCKNVAFSWVLAGNNSSTSQSTAPRTRKRGRKRHRVSVATTPCDDAFSSGSGSNVPSVQLPANELKARLKGATLVNYENVCEYL